MRKLIKYWIWREKGMINRRNGGKEKSLSIKVLNGLDKLLADPRINKNLSRTKASLLHKIHPERIIKVIEVQADLISLVV